MWTRQHKKSKLRFVIIPLAAIAMLSYFSFHALNGSLGLHSSERYAVRINELQVELAELQSEREDYEKRTSLLSDGTLDRDLIDEQARLSLGLSSPNEVILLRNNN